MKLKKIGNLLFLTNLFIFVASTCFSEENRKTHFGVLWHQSDGKIFGVPFLGFYKNDFVMKGASPQTIFSATKGILVDFKTGINYPAIDRNGTPSFITLNQTFEPEGDDVEMLLESKGARKIQAPVLFWTGKEAQLEVQRSSKVFFKESTQELLKRKVRHLIGQANAPLREPKYKLSKILAPILFRPRGKKLVTILFPLILKYTQGENPFDKRASVFFIYDIEKKQIVFSRFGHPEWSPEAENIEVIRPIFFFNLDGKTYIFSKHEGPWESSGYVFIELNSGKIILKSY